MERLDNILKSVATAAVVQVTTNIKEEEQEEQNMEVQEQDCKVKPPGKAGSQKPTLPLKGKQNQSKSQF